MSKVTSNIAKLLNGARIALREDAALGCAEAQDLMSPFIDSMCSANEAQRLELHLSTCQPCQRQLQSFVSMRGLLARMQRPALPEDLVLETRVKLSRARNKSVFAQLELRLNNILKPIALPAIFGVSVTMLFFGVLLGSLASNNTVMAQDHIAETPVFGLYKPVRTTDPTMIRFAASDNQSWDEPLTIETHVGDDGRVIDYRILFGPQNAAVDRWIRETLSLAQFTPATTFGRPVESKIILSFVAVRS
jgi:hypothetical protein